MVDLQDPPPMIKDLIKKWEEGYKIVLAVKNKSEESPVMFAIRQLYYKIYNQVSNIQIVKIIVVSDFMTRQSLIF